MNDLIKHFSHFSRTILVTDNRDNLADAWSEAVEAASHGWNAICILFRNLVAIFGFLIGCFIVPPLYALVPSYCKRIKEMNERREKIAKAHEDRVKEMSK